MSEIQDHSSPLRSYPKIKNLKLVSHINIRFL